MLVVSRSKNDAIVIDENIIITVIEIRGDKVRLGIECPKDVPVHRYEVYQAIYSEARTKETSKRLSEETRQPMEAACVVALSRLLSDFHIRDDDGATARRMAQAAIEALTANSPRFFQ